MPEIQNQYRTWQRDNTDLRQSFKTRDDLLNARAENESRIKQRFQGFLERQNARKAEEETLRIDLANKQ